MQVHIAWHTLVVHAVAAARPQAFAGMGCCAETTRTTALRACVQTGNKRRTLADFLRHNLTPITMLSKLAKSFGRMSGQVLPTREQCS